MTNRARRGPKGVLRGSQRGRKQTWRWLGGAMSLVKRLGGNDAVAAAAQLESLEPRILLSAAELLPLADLNGSAAIHDAYCCCGCCGAGGVIGIPKEPPSDIRDGGYAASFSTLSLDEVFRLHSRPASNFTIFLDFDGHVTEGTLWNSGDLTSIISPAYSLDSNFGAFSSTERDRIERVWRRVAEDFAPFDVNVTTEDPGVEALRNTGGGDTKWGMRVVITDDDYPAPGSGGVAYISTFDSNVDIPCFVFNSGEDGIVEAATHEVGHTLGLSHDGLISPATTYYNGHGGGSTSWGPLLGAPYGRSMTHWDNGTYYQANNGTASANYNSGPDDLAIITTQNGFGYAADDHGNTRPTATSLFVAGGTTVSGFGVIEQNSDVDYFSFRTGTGNVSLTLSPLVSNGNLDIWAGVYDSVGTLIAQSNPATALNATFTNLALTAGTYYVKVDGVGSHGIYDSGTDSVKDPASPAPWQVASPTGYSDYGSLGQYAINGTVVAPGGDTFSVAADQAVMKEGNSGTTAFTFTVTRSGSTGSAATVNYAVTPSLPTAPELTHPQTVSGADFVGGTLPTGVVSFAAGEISKTVTINVVGDTTFEFNEQFELVLSNPSSGWSITTSKATGTIQTDEVRYSVQPAIPSLTYLTEGGTRTFTIEREGDSSVAGTVDWVIDVTGLAIPGTDAVDFGGTLPSGQISFAIGELTRTLVVNVADDNTVEPDEQFKVKLQNAASSLPATVDAALTTALAGVTNEDANVHLQASEMLLRWRQVTHNVATGDNWGLDNVSLTGSTFADDFDPTTDAAQWTSITAGSPSTAFTGSSGNGLFFNGSGTRAATSKIVPATAGTTISFSLIFGNNSNGGDNCEAGEDVVLEYSINGGANWTTIATYDTEDYLVWTALQATVPANGAAGGEPTLSELSSASPTLFPFTVVREGNTAGSASVSWTVTGTGANPAGGSDFVGGVYPSGVITFNPGETSRQIDVPVVADAVLEPDETFLLTLSNWTGEGLIASPASQVGTILNDDTQTNSAPTLTTVSALPGATEDTTFAIAYSALAAAADEADINDDPISFRVEAVTSGTLTKDGSAVTPGATLLSAGESWVWTPAANANGSTVAAFTIKAWDGQAASATAVQVNVNVAAVNDAPTLTTISTLPGATEDTAFTINSQTLLAAADEADIDGNPLSFRIESVSSGTLTKNSVPVTPGVTLLSLGESLVWTPALNANGTLPAFTVKAFDGQAASAGAVQVNVDVAAVAEVPQYTVKHNPRLQPGNAPLAGYAGSELDRVDILWQTVPAGAGTQDTFIVEYRAVGAGAWQPASLNATIDTAVQGRLVWSTTVTGLNWDSDYEYRVQHVRADELVAQFQSTFRTRLAAGDDTSFSFVAYGDSATGDASGFRLVQDRINQLDPKFAVLLGDNVYDIGSHPESDARFDPLINPEAATWMASHIDLLGLGNHDVDASGGGGLPSEQNYSVPIPVAGVNAPAAPPATERTEHNFSWDYGDVHFVTFDTNSLLNTSRLDGLLNWVVADLNASTARWKIVYGHHPLAGVPDKPETPGGNYYQQVVNRLKAAGVDLFMTGHSHTYAWTYPLTGQINGTATYIDHGHDDEFTAGEGLTQLVSGVGGKEVRTGSFSQFPFVAEGFTSTTAIPGRLGFSKIDVTQGQLTVSYVAADNGQIIDSFTIAKDDTVQSTAFQQGIAGYTGTVDTYLHQNTPTTSFAAATSLNVDGDDPGGTGFDAQGLLRFENLFGGGAGQIPSNAVIRSATLQLQVTNASVNNMNLHRMLGAWSASDTWNSRTGGIQTDGLEAVAAPDTSSGQAQVGALSFNVLPSLQAWKANPATNFGWAMLPTGTDGLDFHSSEGAVKPKLIVSYVIPLNSDPTDIALSAAAVAENQPAGTVVGSLSTTDPDAGDTFTYALVNGAGSDDNASFAVVAGELRTASVFDFEAKNLFSIRLRTTDAGGLMFEKQFSINISNVNETPTSIALSQLAVTQGMDGAAVGAVSVTDPDAADAHVLTVSDARFEVAGDVLKLKAGESLSQATEPAVSVQVTATDLGGLGLSRTFLVTVLPAAVSISVPEPALSDTILSLPLAPWQSSHVVAGVMAGGLLVDDVLPVNQYQGLHYVRLLTGNGAGLWSTIVSNSAGELVLENPAVLAHAAAGDVLSIYAHQTLATAFPDAMEGVSFIASPSGFSRLTEVFLLNEASVGINKAAAASFFYTAGEWRRIGQVGSFDNTVLAPDAAFILRNNTSLPLTFEATGTPLPATLARLLPVYAEANDNITATGRATPTTLGQLNLGGTAAFATSASGFNLADQLFVFDNASPGFNKSASAVYYYSSNAWRKVGASGVFDSEILPVAAVIVIRKKAGTPGTLLWTQPGDVL